MRSLIILTALLALFSLQAQKKAIFVDTDNEVINFNDWSTILFSGQYSKKLDTVDGRKIWRWFPLTPEDSTKMYNNIESRIVKHELSGKAIQLQNMTDIYGNTIDPSILNSKIVFLNFWFVGCGPCETERPLINELITSFEGRDDVVFLSFSRSNDSKTKRFIEKKPINMPVILLNDEFLDQLSISSYPTNIILDRNGEIATYMQGIQPGTVRYMKGKIEELIN